MPLLSMKSSMFTILPGLSPMSGKSQQVNTALLLTLGLSTFVPFAGRREAAHNSTWRPL